jgi:hypothetical protein
MLETSLETAVDGECDPSAPGDKEKGLVTAPEGPRDLNAIRLAVHDSGPRPQYFAVMKE